MNSRTKKGVDTWVIILLSATHFHSGYVRLFLISSLVLSQSVLSLTLEFGEQSSSSYFHRRVNKGISIKRKHNLLQLLSEQTTTSVVAKQRHRDNDEKGSLSLPNMTKCIKKESVLLKNDPNLFPLKIENGFCSLFPMQNELKTFVYIKDRIRAMQQLKSFQCYADRKGHKIQPPKV